MMSLLFDLLRERLIHHKVNKEVSHVMTNRIANKEKGDISSSDWWVWEASIICIFIELFEGLRSF